MHRPSQPLDGPQGGAVRFLDRAREEVQPQSQVEEEEVLPAELLRDRTGVRGRRLLRRRRRERGRRRRVHRVQRRRDSLDEEEGAGLLRLQLRVAPSAQV